MTNRSWLSEVDIAQAMGRTVDVSTLSVPRSLDWQREAICRTDVRVERETADSFFPLGRPLKTVKQMCRECPVREACLALALADELEGIWGGTTTKEREAMRHAG